jgi:hypothetical protein
MRGKNILSNNKKGKIKIVVKILQLDTKDKSMEHGLQASTK